MLYIAYYFLQVILCSAVMMVYYLLALRNKRFHQYNRFYLLSAAVLPWILPLIKIQFNRTVAEDANVIRLFAVVANSNSEMEETVSGAQYLSWSTLFAVVYIAVFSCLLISFIIGLVRLYKLLKGNSCKTLGDVYLVLTQAEGTPFSFFKFIFWNTEIDVNTTSGKQVLKHELAHVQERHSIDKVLIQIVIMLGWFNPFFWLIRKELEMIHEFIADTKAVENGDTASLAAMLLTAAFPQQKFELTNPFFYSPIKRRLLMLTNNKNPRFSYVRRLIILPVLAFVTLLFAFRSKSHKPITISVASTVETLVKDITKDNTANNTKVNVTNYTLDKVYTVVIDAGHGGFDGGAVATDGTKESKLTLEIAKVIKQLNENSKINIVLTRESDVYMSPADKANFSNKHNADVFVSLHLNEEPNAKKNTSGLEIFLANPKKTAFAKESSVLSNALATSLKPLDNDIKLSQREVGIWVLQATKCASSLVECGYMSSNSDLAKLKTDEYQKQLATSILNGIGSYLLSLQQKVVFVTDTVPNDAIKLKNVQLIDDHGDKTFLQAMSINYKPKELTDKHPLIVIDGVKVLWKVGDESFKNIDPNTIAKIEILKNNTAVEEYGDEGKDGVIKIYTKGKMSKDELLELENRELKEENRRLLLQQYQNNKEDATLSKVFAFTQVEISPAFPGGTGAWKTYLQNNLNQKILTVSSAPPGKYTVTVSFVVDKSGNVSEVKALNDPGYGTAAEAERVIKNGPAWRPGIQNGQTVTSSVRQPIVFVKPG